MVTMKSSLPARASHPVIHKQVLNNKVRGIEQSLEKSAGK